MINVKNYLVLFFISLQSVVTLYSQELYVFNEPASTLPARSISFKLKNHLVQETALLSQFSFRTLRNYLLGLIKT